MEYWQICDVIGIRFTRVVKTAFWIKRLRNTDYPTVIVLDFLKCSQIFSPRFHNLIFKGTIEFDLDEGRMDYLDDMIDVFSKDGCEMVDILFDRFLKKYYADIDVSNERMTINLTDEEGHVLSFNLSQSEVHYVLHMVERRLNSFMRDDGGGGFGDKD